MNFSETGTIFDIQRCSLHDGPGIRTTVFLKGCPLSCKWCHNPESQSAKPQIAFFPDKCNLCGRCATICSKVHSITDGIHTTDFSNCTLCGKCIDSCPFEAIRLFGKIASVQDIMDVILKDKSYYHQTQGGVTFSGGEPFMQVDFLKTLLVACKKEKLHTCVETCGFTSRENLEGLLPYIDMFLFDYKETTPEKHKSFTGVDNKLILDNLDYLYQQGKMITLRCPIIPGYNDTSEHFQGIHQMEVRYPNLCGIEILPYHNFGKDKAIAIGNNYEITAPTADSSLKEKWKAEMQRCNCSSSIINSF